MIRPYEINLNQCKIKPWCDQLLWDNQATMSDKAVMITIAENRKTNKMIKIIMIRIKYQQTSTVDVQRYR